jgi:putative DNA primase/helicase
MNFDKIPQELKDLEQWVCWKGIINEKGKISKIPVNPRTGGGAMSNNPATWSDFETAVKAAEAHKYSGVGFMFDEGYFGVDLDDAEENLKNEFISKLQSYTEVSVSGKGIHIICRGKLPDGSRRKGKIEMYDTRRFFVMTGNTIGEFQVRDGTETIKELHDKYIADKEPIKYVVNVKQTSTEITDDEVIRKASNSKNGNLFTLLLQGNWEGLSYQSQSEADMAFSNMLAFWTRKNKTQMDRIVRMSGLYREKWDKKHGKATYGEMTLDNAIAKTLNVYDPNRESKEVNYNATTGEVNIQIADKYETNDTGNAKRIVSKFGTNIRYNFENKQWMLWNGKQWIPDVKNQIKTMAEMVAQDMKQAALTEDDKELQKAMLKNTERALSTNGKESMIKETQHAEGIPCVNQDFDRNSMLINTENGIVDLKSGELKQHDKNQMQSKMVHYEVDPTTPQLWLKFLDEIFKSDQELIKFIQKAVGYTLTGSIQEQCMFILYGDGANGKSVFLEVLSTMLGDYAVNAQVDTILSKKGVGTNASSDLARLKGARMVTTSEPNEGSKFNEGLIKQITGGDRITARFLYGKEFEFHPEFKLWLSTNYKPVIRGTDMGIWRRIRLVPFEAKFTKEKQDKTLAQKLVREIPKIINWAISGALLWQKEGLESPASIEDATKEYKNEMDIINTFVDECCQVVKNYETGAKEVYDEYANWSKQGNEYLMSLTRFGKEMGKRFEKKKTRSGIVYIGLRLSKNDPTYVYKRDPGEPA